MSRRAELALAWLDFAAYCAGRAVGSVAVRISRLADRR